MANGGVGGGAGNCCGGLCGLLFTVGFIVLIYWATFQPHKIRATVETAELSNLAVSSYTNTSTGADVSYRLAVTLNLYNPSVRVNIYYDTIHAELRFRDTVIGPAANGTSPAEFYQRRKTSDDVKLEFDYGRRSGVAVAGDVAGELEREAKSGGSVSLELHVGLRVSYVFRMFKLRQKPRIRCSLSIPVKAEGRRRGVGSSIDYGDRCKVKY